MTVVLKGGLVDCGRGRFERTDVVVEDGRILDVGPPSSPAGAELVDASDRLVIPGLINAHTHSGENWLRGCFDNLPLEAWLLYAYPRLAAPAQSAREVYLRTAIGAMEMAATGTTSVVDFLVEPSGHTAASIGAVVEAYRDVGIRALICIGIADRPYLEVGAIDPRRISAETRRQLESLSTPTASECLALVRGAVTQYHRPSQGVSIGIAPSGPFRCTDELLMGALDLARKRDLEVHTHTLETKVEATEGGRLSSPTTIDRLERIGFLDPRVHLCHGVWIRDDDAALIAGHGTGVVHNPISNLKLGSGVAPIPLLRSAGVRTALGTDGVCTGDGYDLFQALKLAAILHKPSAGPPSAWIGAGDAWAMATDDGARAMGNGAGLGRIEPGRCADLVMIDAHDSAFVPLNDPLRQIVLGGRSSAVSDVMIGGRWVMRGGQLVSVCRQAIASEAREAAAGVLGRNRRAWALAGDLAAGAYGAWAAVDAMEFDVDRRIHRAASGLAARG